MSKWKMRCKSAPRPTRKNNGSITWSKIRRKISTSPPPIFLLQNLFRVCSEIKNDNEPRLELDAISPLTENRERLPAQGSSLSLPYLRWQWPIFLLIHDKHINYIGSIFKTSTLPRYDSKISEYQTFTFCPFSIPLKVPPP
jgi:hypothetical protein